MHQELQGTHLQSEHWAEAGYGGGEILGVRCEGWQMSVVKRCAIATDIRLGWARSKRVARSARMWGGFD